MNYYVNTTVSSTEDCRGLVCSVRTRTFKAEFTKHLSCLTCALFVVIESFHIYNINIIVEMVTSSFDNDSVTTHQYFSILDIQLILKFQKFTFIG